jgi:hypothetical protein
MKRAFVSLGAAGVLGAALLLQQPLPAQQPASQQPPARKAADPQPTGDAVAPTAGEKKSPADAPGRRSATGPGSNSKGSASAAVRTLHLPELDTDLPNRPGRNAVVVVCGVCHTTRYITIQPPLSRDTWIAEITKMQKTFGAPIPADKTDEILNYLLSVRGPDAK